MRSAERSSPAELWSPRSSGVGGGKLAISTFSSAGNAPTTSSWAPPSGRSTNSSASEPGCTTHSRPRARTSTPGTNSAASGTLLLIFRGSFQGLPGRLLIAGAENGPVGRNCGVPVAVVAKAEDIPAFVGQPFLGFRVPPADLLVVVSRSIDENGDLGLSGQPVDVVRLCERLGDENLLLGGEPVPALL